MKIFHGRCVIQVFFIFFLLFSVFSGISCTDTVYRKIKIIIPPHPWEETGNIELWYKIKWNEGTEIKTKFIYNNLRQTYLKIPLGQTVYICAYPLGSMLSFGTGVSPSNNKNTFVLNQNEGFIADLLLNSKEEATLSVNFEKLVQSIKETTDDFRNIDTDFLLQSILNKRLSGASIKKTEQKTFYNIPMYSGLWIPESCFDEIISVSEDGYVYAMNLCPGVHRYICIKRNLEIRLVVSQDSQDEIIRYEKIPDVKVNL